MPRIALALSALLLLAGCPGVLAPSMDPVRRRCAELTSHDAAVRADALGYLEHEFVVAYWVKYKHITQAHRAELASCLPRVAHLLRDLDPTIRARARRTLTGMRRHAGGLDPRTAQEVVSPVLQDAWRLWRAEGLPPAEAAERPRLLEQDLKLLGIWGLDAPGALALVEAILAAPDLPLGPAPQHATPDPFGWPPAPSSAGGEPLAPTLQDEARVLAWHLGGQVGPDPRFAGD